ncbi:MAG: D-glycero-beta-D-manno-heptose-7-phosphate kinase [Desulfamplus sp.]|nr:D-glycero-beta-D-manno-heptose-7-phosphate kinase [Desulfamplus sp.]
MAVSLENFFKSKILVIGDIMLDCYLWGKVERISPEAPVPIVQALKRTYMLGGAGNVALNLASIGCKSDIVAICGDDRAGGKIRQMVEGHKITNHLIFDNSHLTISKTRVMALEQQLLRIDEERIQTLREELKEAVLSKIKEIVGSYQVVILSDYGKGFLKTPNITESIISICRAKGVAVLVDPKGRDWDRYKNATCVTPNSAELNLVANEIIDSDNELIEASERIRKLYALEWLLITRGAKGMCLTGRSRAGQGFNGGASDNQTPLLIPTQARQVYDVSGAGDTVIAMLAAGLSVGLSFEDAARLANKAAGVVVGKVGTQPITKDELNAILISS